MSRKIALLMTFVMVASVMSGNQTRADDIQTEPIIMEADTLEQFAEDVSELTNQTVSGAAESPPHMDSAENDEATDNDYRSKTLMVQSETEIISSAAIGIIRYGNLYILSYDSEADTRAAYEQFKGLPDIGFVEVDNVVEISEDSLDDAAADTEESQQVQTGETALQTYIAGLEPQTDVIAAIIDTGIDMSDETLSGNRIVDSGLNYSNSGENTSTLDDNGHGTDMANLIAASTTEHVKLMPIKAANKEGKATVLSVYLAVKSAIERQVDIINLSMNASAAADSSKLLESVIDEAVGQGIPVVVSAGNNSMDVVDIIPSNIESAVVVSAVNEKNELADYSNYGDTIDYCSYGTYGEKEGTSYAAAYVTAVMAELIACGEADAIAVLNEYAVDLGESGVDRIYGNGFISLYEYSNIHDCIDSIESEDENKHDDTKNEMDKSVDMSVSAYSTTTDRDYTKTGYHLERYQTKTCTHTLATNECLVVGFETTSVKPANSWAGNYSNLSVYNNASGAPSVSKSKFELTTSTYAEVGSTWSSVCHILSKMKFSDDLTETSVEVARPYRCDVEGQSGYVTYEAVYIYCTTLALKGWYYTDRIMYSANCTAGSTGIPPGVVNSTKQTMKHNYYVYNIVNNSYSVKYNGNGNTGGSMSNSSHTYDTAKNLTANGYTRTGYTFAGWATSTSGAVKYANSASVKNLTATNNGTVNLYAKWTPITYSVKYNGNGNTGGSMSDSSHTYDAAKNLTANGYTRTGYTFAGWATSTSGAVAYANSSSVKNLSATNGATVNLYAKWTPITYTVAYAGNGNTGGSTANSSHTYDVSGNLSTNGYVKSYDFVYNGNSTDAMVIDGSSKKGSITKNYAAAHQGWYKEAGGTTRVTAGYNLTTTAGATVTLYAKWNAISVTLLNAQREGHIFLGWSTNSKATEPDVGYEAGKTVTVTSAKTLYAVWEPKTVRIRYNANGGSGNMPDGVKSWDVDYTMSENAFEHPGYSFQGWSTDAGATEPEYRAGDIYRNTIDSDYDKEYITFYAIWKAKLVIDYSGNGQSSGEDFSDAGEDGTGYTVNAETNVIMSDNMDEDTGEEHFTKKEVETITNEITGESYGQEITGKIVGWTLDVNNQELNYTFELGQNLSSEELYSRAVGMNVINTASTNVYNGLFQTASETADITINPLFTVRLTAPALFSAPPDTSMNVHIPAIAVWDMGAKIEAYDLYYTLKDAQSGYITEDELLNHATAWDEELKGAENPKGNLLKGVDTANHTTFDVWDYAPTDFTLLEHNAIMSETYRAIDSAGNVTMRQIMVHIVDTTAYDTEPETGKARFIIKEYFPWTLDENSVWVKDPTLRQELEDALNNKRVDQELSDPVFGLSENRVIKPGSGHWEKEPEQVWKFSHEDVLRVKKFVDEHGIGNLLEEDALAKFLVEFADNHIK